MAQSKFWVFTDPHFGHDKLTEDGFRPVGFSERIMANLHRYLGPGNVLVCLGDFAFKDDAYWCERLSRIEGCKKWLCLGNHDKRSISWYLSNGFDWVGHYFRMDMFGKRILFSHKPRGDKDDYDLNIYGHFHSFGLDRVKNMEPELYNLLTPKHRLLSMEATNYEPIKLQRFVGD